MAKADQSSPAAPPDETAQLRLRITELEAEVARLRRAHDEALQEWVAAQEQSSRLVESTASQRLAALNLIQELRDALRQSEADHDAARKAQESLRLVVESLPSGLILVDGEGRIVLANRQAEDLFGYRREEVRGQPIETLVPQGFRATHPTFWAEYLANPEARRFGAAGDLHGRHKDSSTFPIEISLHPIHPAEGALLGAVVEIARR
jgi:PAS domain S-box-containing protein